MRQQIRTLIEKAVKKLYPGVEIEFSVVFPPPGVEADFASNVAMVLAKKIGKQPMEAAEAIKQYILEHPQDDNLQTIEVAAPGFLNFSVVARAYEATLNAIFKERDRYGGFSRGKNNEEILVEYFQPNIAKQLHIGHMRSAIIGDCLYRIEKLFARRVESDTHMGDWGTQFGLLLLAYKRWDGKKILDSYPNNPLEGFNRLYVDINKEMAEHPEQRDEAKQEFVKLEKGDLRNRQLWQEFVRISMDRFLKINELLDISPFDHHWPESFYEDKMQSVLKNLKKQGLLKESEGAQIVDLNEPGLGTAVIVKSDGGTTYLLRDLATFLYRKHQQKFMKQLYVVDSRQIHHFKQLFKILELLGEWKAGEGAHVEFGFMSLPEGALSTRKGNIIELEEVVAKATEKAKQIIAKKNPDLKNADEIARDVAIGALKYFDLSHNRLSDITFSWEKALNFEGNAGPYLQYTHARIKSILRKAGKNIEPLREYHLDRKEEKQLLRLLSIFFWILAEVIDDYSPNHLTDYLYHLASEFNNYYHKVRILQEPDERARESRLRLAFSVAQVLKNGLYLLGIKAPEEM